MTWFRVPHSVDLVVARFLIAGVVCVFSARAIAGEVPIVAAASSLNPALNELSESFQREKGAAVRLSYGSSGNIARQIIWGAPYELFLSADERYVRDLVERSLTIGDGALYGGGRLVLYVPRNSKIQLDPELKGMKKALSDGRLTRLAIAHPEHAPYGRAARQLLERHGIWDRLHRKLVLGENVSQTAQFAATGSVDAAIFSYSMTFSTLVSRRGAFVLMPEESHDPINHRMVLLEGAGEIAHELYVFLQGPIARKILYKYGFTAPGTSPR